MKAIFRLVRNIMGRLVMLILVYYTLARVVRHFTKFPIPEFLADLIDNPLRRRLQPPYATAIRHGLAPGMTVLEVGPGSGTYTFGAARCVGPSGQVVAIDIAPKIITRLQQRITEEGLPQIEARVANVYDLPYADDSFDAAFMIAVMGEIPQPEKGLREVYRVLKPGGTLAVSELLFDPDYPLASKLTRQGFAAGFQLQKKVGNFFYYTLIFVKDPAAGPGQWQLQTPAWHHDRSLLRRSKNPPQIAYKLGLGPILGRMVLLLTTTGRKSGLPRVTPLQYERIEDVIYVLSVRGDKADWFRNIQANPQVEVQVKNQRWRGQAEAITDPARIADVLAIRLERHPRMIGTLFQAEGLPLPPTREQLETYAASRAMVALHRADE